MKILSVLFILPLMSPLFAQDDPERGDESRDWFTRMIVNRLQDQLDLSDEQTEKLRGVIKDVRKIQDDKVRAILTDEQKEKFKGVRESFEGGNRGRRGMGGGGFRGMRNVDIDRLKERLGLSDEQVEKIEPIVEELTSEIEERMEELRENGSEGFNWREAMQEYRERMKKFGDDVKEHLSDEQKEKFDEMMGGRRGRNRENRRGRSPEEATQGALERLAIENKEEKEAISLLIRKVADAQGALRSFGRESRPELKKMGEKEDVAEKEIERFLETHRAKRCELQKALQNARKELREVVSYRQELALIEMGLID